MTCVAPPELDVTRLLQAIDGVANSEILEHLNQCDYCRRRRDRLRRAQATLIKQLFRLDCPSPEALISFAEGELSEADTAASAEHLRDCPHCQRELTMTQRSDDPAFDTGGRREVQLTIGRRRGSARGGKPAYFPVRTGARIGADQPLLFDAGELQVSVQVRSDAESGGQLTVYGLMTGVDPEGWTAELIRDGDLIGQTSPDKHGNFVFRALEPGEYELALSSSDREVVLEPFDVAA